MREYADEDTNEKINRALEPPKNYRYQGAPVWYGSDDDAWADWERQAR